jgi:hypothetical protein
MNTFLKNKYPLIVSGILLGAVSGFFYWKFWGCTNGCAIKSVWWRMSLWGAVMGGLLMSMLYDFLNRKKVE